MAFVDDWPLVLADPFDRPPGPGADLFGGQPGPDERLDLTRSRTTVHLDLDLAEPGPVMAGRSPQGVVDGQGEPLTVGADENDAAAVLMDADEA